MKKSGLCGALACSAVLLLAAFALSGCEHHPLDCAVGFMHSDCLPNTLGGRRISERVTGDDDTCRSYGLQFGTGAYAECRERLAGNRQAVAGTLLGAYATRSVAPVTPEPYMMPTSRRPLTTNCFRTGQMVNCTTN